MNNTQQRESERVWRAQEATCGTLLLSWVLYLRRVGQGERATEPTKFSMDFIRLDWLAMTGNALDMDMLRYS